MEMEILRSFTHIDDAIIIITKIISKYKNLKVLMKFIILVIINLSKFQI